MRSSALTEDVRRHAVVIALAALSVLLALFIAPSSFAQDAPPAPVATQSQAVLIANIEFASIGVSYATSTRTIKADASMQNKFGDISNAVFGLELSAQGVRDAAFAAETLTLGEGMSATRSASLQIPLDVSGAVSVRAVIKSESGVTLAAEPVWSGTVAAALSGPAPLSCRQNEPLSVSCTVASGSYGLSYVIYQNALGGKSQSATQKSGVSGATLSLPESSPPPGHYVMLVHLSDARGVASARAYDLYIGGAQGSIDTFLPQVQEDGSYRIVATTHAFSDTPGFTLTFQGYSGSAPCGTPLTVAAASSVTQAVFAPGCSADSITATLSAGDTVLDTASARILSTPETGRSPWFWSAILAAAVLLVGLGALLMRKKQQPPLTPPIPPVVPTT